MVHASYSEADDLINELDRPSKYQTLIAFCLLFLIYSLPPPSPLSLLHLGSNVLFVAFGEREHSFNELYDQD